MAPLSHVATFITSAIVAPTTAIEPATPQCKRFDEIYASGKELCENMWNDAFVYEEDESKAYTMWFWDQENPNNQVSQDLGLLEGNHDICHLDYYHKDTPGPEPDNFTECHPWKDNACCAHQTVMSATKLKEGYGAEYHWDRCGPLSPECERFFVQEACFYECDPNAGLFRKWNTSDYDPRCDADAVGFNEAFATAQGCDHNAWQMQGMPIKASYCNSWLSACAKDRFCAAADGDFFTCATHYEAFDLAAVELENTQAQLAEQQRELKRMQAENNGLRDEPKMSSGILALIIILACIASASGCGGVYLIRREKSGKPVFTKQVDEGAGGATADTYGNSA